MIKLIATDIDGTLCPVGTSEIDSSYYPLIRKLLDMGVHVAAASGRQYPALAHLFEPMQEEMIYVADNGAHVRIENRDFYVSKMDLEVSHELVRDVRALGDGCECAYCVAGTAYFSPEDKNIYRIMKENMNYECCVVDSLESLEEPCIKMTIYHPTDAERAVSKSFVPKWEERLQIACSGDIFVDVMNLGTNKGMSLRKVQEYYGISKEETMVFGDNINDLQMLEAAHYSYAVGDAREEVLASARFTAPPMRENGVMKILRGLLNRFSR